MSRSGLCWCIEHEQCQDLCKLFKAEAINQCRGQVFAGASNMSSIGLVQVFKAEAINQCRGQVFVGASNMSSIRTCASYLQQRPSISVEVRSLLVHRT